MLAQRTDKVVWKHIPFIDISAYLAYKAFLSFRLRLRLNIVLVVGVSHGLLIAHNSGFRYGADEHAVGT